MGKSLPPLLVLLFLVGTSRASFFVSKQDTTILLNGKDSFFLQADEELTDDLDIFFESSNDNLIRAEPSHFKAKKNEKSWEITILALSPGKAYISANVSDIPASEFGQAFVRVTVERSDALYHISSIIGWIYFLAWSISFYPQIYSNYKRKSVVGLNFDYLSLNIVGFIMYAMFNCGMRWIPEIEQEYFSRNPKGLNPVQLNDIFFSLHAVAATLFTIFQCFIYETGSQKVSTTARIIHGVFTSFVLGSAIFGVLHTITWLDFLYYCSYVKLAITLIKYVPQAFYNYKRQSTIGWSIGNIFLDFTGGILSMLQMILNAYNYDDWESLMGDPTKFGLGFFSVAFDIFFLLQHYVFYRDRNDYTVIPGSCNENPEESA